MKTLIKMLPAFFLAWLFSPVLMEIVPVLSDWSFPLFPELDKVVNGLRIVIWTIGLAVLFKIVPPLWRVFLPLWKQISILKPVRRVMWIGSEALMVGLFFLLISIGASPPHNMQAEIEERQEAARTLEEEDPLSALERLLAELDGDETADESAQVDIRQQVRMDVLKRPWRYILPAFGDVWTMALPAALALYLLTFLRFGGKRLRHYLALWLLKIRRRIEQMMYGRGGSSKFGSALDEWVLTYETRHLWR